MEKMTNLRGKVGSKQCVKFSDKGASTYVLSAINNCIANKAFCMAMF
jgi:hypothetical protein